MTKFTRFTYLFVVAVVAIASTLVVNYFIMAWTEPTGIPPEGSVNITVDWDDISGKPSSFPSNWNTMSSIPADFDDDVDDVGGGGECRFGGAYNTWIWGGCREPNPATGGCSCPTGYTGRYMGGGYQNSSWDIVAMICQVCP